jgi:cytochrome c2
VKYKIAVGLGVLVCISMYYTTNTNYKSAEKIQELIMAADMPTSRQLFNNNCGHCHSLEIGTQMIGPSLANVYNNKVANEDNFMYYSDDIQNLDHVWDESELFNFIRYGRSYFSKINMSYEGIESDQDAAAIVKLLIEKSN